MPERVETMMAAARESQPGPSHLTLHKTHQEQYRKYPSERITAVDSPCLLVGETII